MRKPAIVTISPTGGGVVKDLPPHELQANEWSDSSNIRFANGMAIRRGGIREAWTTPLVIPYALEAYATVAGTRYLVQAGIQKVYVDDGATQTEITRKTDGKAIQSITNATTTATLTTSTAHGLSNGNTVTVFGAVPSAYNGTFTITVTGATTFTYTMLSDPGGSATTVGQYHGSSTSNFTGSIDDKWTISVLSGILILNNPVDGPYYWNGDITTPMRRLPGWAAGEKCYAMRAFKNFLIALAPTLSGTFYPHVIRWSVSAEAGAIPTTWTSSSTNDAGDLKQAAEVGGFLVDGLPLGDEFIAYKDDGIFALQFVGQPAVFSLRRLPGRDGLIARNCVVETPRGHVFMSNGDVRIHSGGASVSIIEGRNRSYLFGGIDGTHSRRSFLALNPPKTEVWIAFPTYSQSVPDRVLAWNWNSGEAGAWSIFDIPPCTCAATGLIAGGVDSEAWEDDPESWNSDVTRWYAYEYSPNELRLVLGFSGLKLGLADTGTKDLGDDFTWWLEKTGTALGNNDAMKVILASRPQFSANPGTVVLVYHTTTLQASDQPFYPASVSYTVGTSEWANRFSKAGRFLAIRYEGTDDAIVILRSYDVKFALQGAF